MLGGKSSMYLNFFRDSGEYENSQQMMFERKQHPTQGQKRRTKNQDSDSLLKW
jgi:hypothetical protein